MSPQEYLGAAKQLLEMVPTKSLDGDGQTKLSQLREDLTSLVTRYQTRSLAALGSGASVASGAKDPVTDVVAWKMKFGDVERDLTLILGGRSSRSVSSTTGVGTTGVVGSAAEPTGRDSSTRQPAGTDLPASRRGLGGVAQPEIGVKNLDPSVRTQLEQVRTSVELFYDATGRSPLAGIGPRD
jgi:hypothetical protein